MAESSPTPLTDAEQRSITGAAQRCLAEGETGMDRGDCNRAGWHVGRTLAPIVERIVADRVAAARADERERCAREVDAPGYGTAAIRLRHLALAQPADTEGA